jgi:hypothetical protein
VVTRRVLLGAGAAGAGTLLAGCGARPPAPVAAGTLLDRALAADRAALAAYRGLAAQAPAGARPLLARMRRATAARARRLRAAGARAGAPGSEAEPARPSAREAQRREQVAAAAYVDVLGAVRGERRALAAEGLGGAAEHAALLGALFGLPTDTAFPGSRA